MASKRNYKDGVFTTLFHDHDKILELFNALEGTSYGSDTEVQIQTLSDVLYAVRKNDLAFSIDNRFIVLTEHQSSICPNMPFRFLLYIPRVYEKMVNNKLIYKDKPITLQTPEFYVLYNGTEDFPLEHTYKLSDLYIKKPDHVPLELEVKVININPKKGHMILTRSSTLNQYSQFIDKVKEFLGQKLSRDEAIKKAIHWCMEHNILSEFLKTNGSEVYNMLFEEYNVETALQVREEEAMETATENVAINLLKMGDSIEKVQLATGLSTKRIKELSEQSELRKPFTPINSGELIKPFIPIQHE